MYFIIAVSAIPYFYLSTDLVLIGMLISLVFFVAFNCKFDKIVLYVLVMFFIVEVLQIIYLGSFSFRTFAGTFVRLLFAYFVVKVLSTNFDKVYCNIILVFSVISLFFYSMYLFPSVTEYIVVNIAPIFESPFKDESGFYEQAPNVLFFTYDLYDRVGLDQEFFRNAGPFWEAGAFSCFINIAILFNVLRGESLFSVKNLVLILTLITTVSTAGYIALLVLIFFAVTTSKNSKFRFVLFFVVPIMGYYVYNQFSFMGEKVQENIVYGQSAYTDATTSRIGSALADLKDFYESPLIGWGRGESRYGGRQYSYFNIQMHRNNGVTILLVTYGVFIFIFYFYMYYRSFLAICRHYNNSEILATGSLLVFLLIGFSQGLFLLPFFYAILYLSEDYTFAEPEYEIDEDTEDEVLSEELEDKLLNT